MSEPVVFISHFAIKEGMLDDLRRLSADVMSRLRSEKPRTVVFLAYLDEQGTEISFLHTFPDAESMDLHFEAWTSASRPRTSTWNLGRGRSTDGPTRERWRGCGKAPRRQASPSPSCPTTSAASSGSSPPDRRGSTTHLGADGLEPCRVG